MAFKRLPTIVGLSFIVSTTAFAETGVDLRGDFCRAAYDAMQILFEFSKEDENLPQLRERRIVRDEFRFVAPFENFHRPKSIDKNEWKKYIEFSPGVAPSGCPEFSADDSQFEFAPIGPMPDPALVSPAAQNAASFLSVSNPHIRDDGKAYVVRVDLTNLSLARRGGSVWDSVFAIIEMESEKAPRIAYVYREFVSGKSQNARVTKRCSNPDDWDDCKIDVAFFRRD